MQIPAFRGTKQAGRSCPGLLGTAKSYPERCPGRYLGLRITLRLMRAMKWSRLCTASDGVPRSSGFLPPAADSHVASPPSAADPTDPVVDTGSWLGCSPSGAGSGRVQSVMSGFTRSKVLTNVYLVSSTCFHLQAPQDIPSNPFLT